MKQLADMVTTNTVLIDNPAFRHALRISISTLINRNMPNFAAFDDITRIEWNESGLLWVADDLLTLL
jgi:hypothetical protein